MLKKVKYLSSSHIVEYSFDLNGFFIFVVLSKVVLIGFLLHKSIARSSVPYCIVKISIKLLYAKLPHFIQKYELYSFDLQMTEGVKCFLNRIQSQPSLFLIWREKCLNHFLSPRLIYKLYALYSYLGHAIHGHMNDQFPNISLDLFLISF